MTVYSDTTINKLFHHHSESQNISWGVLKNSYKWFVIICKYFPLITLVSIVMKW